MPLHLLPGFVGELSWVIFLAASDFFIKSWVGLDIYSNSGCSRQNLLALFKTAGQIVTTFKCQSLLGSSGFNILQQFQHFKI